MKTKKLHLNKIENELAGLTMREVKERFAQYYGYTPNTRNRRHLVKKILWAVQRDLEGDISDSIKVKALTIADDRDVRDRFPNVSSLLESQSLNLSFKPKLELLPGTVLQRNYQGTDIRVIVLEEGFEWNGEHYKSLSATARAITGTRWNGKLFFGLKTGGAQ